MRKYFAFVIALLSFARFAHAQIITPINRGLMQSDLNGGGHSITNVSGVFDPNGNPIGGSGGSATNAFKSQVSGSGLTLTTNGSQFFYTFVLSAALQGWNGFTPQTYSNLLNGYYDLIGSSQASTNAMGIASGLAAFRGTNTFAATNVATASTVGLVKVDGSTVTVASDGTISAVTGGGGNVVGQTPAVSGNFPQYVSATTITNSGFSPASFDSSGAATAATNAIGQTFARTNDARAVTFSSASNKFSGALTGSATTATTATNLENRGATGPGGAQASISTAGNNGFNIDDADGSHHGITGASDTIIYTNASGIWPWSMSDIGNNFIAGIHTNGFTGPGFMAGLWTMTTLPTDNSLVLTNTTRKLVSVRIRTNGVIYADGSGFTNMPPSTNYPEVLGSIASGNILYFTGTNDPVWGSPVFYAAAAPSGGGGSASGVVLSNYFVTSTNAFVWDFQKAQHLSFCFETNLNVLILSNIWAATNYAGLMQLDTWEDTNGTWPIDAIQVVGGLPKTNGNKIWRGTNASEFDVATVKVGPFLTNALFSWDTNFQNGSFTNSLATGGGGGGGSFALVNYVASNTNAASLGSCILNTTGAKLLVINVQWSGGNLTVTTGGDTVAHTPVFAGSGAAWSNEVFYVLNSAHTGSSQTFTIQSDSSSGWPAWTVAAFSDSGTPTLDTSTGLNGSAGNVSTLTLPFVTPSNNNELGVAAYSWNNSATFNNINSGYTVITNFLNLLNTSYIVETTATAKSPTLTLNANSDVNAGVSVWFIP